MPVEIKETDDADCANDGSDYWGQVHDYSEQVVEAYRGSDERSVRMTKWKPISGRLTVAGG